MSAALLIQRLPVEVVLGELLNERHVRQGCGDRLFRRFAHLLVMIGRGEAAHRRQSYSGTHSLTALMTASG